MAIYAAYVDTTTPSSPVVTTSVPSGWIVSVSQTSTGVYDIDYSALALTQPTVVQIQSIDSAATGDGANAAWFDSETLSTTQAPVATATAFEANFKNQNGNALLDPDGFFIIMEDMEP